MKKTLFAALSAFSFALFQASSVLAQPAAAPVATPAASQKATPALWVVKDRDTTIYLFGTFHLMAPGIDWNHGKVKSAFESADTLKLEIANIEAEAPIIGNLMASKGQLPAGQTIYDGLTEAQKTALSAIIAQSGFPPEAIQQMRPWMGSLILSLGLYQKLGLDPNQGVDKTLDGLARAANKPVEGFETGAEQIGFFANLTDQQQKAMLVSTIEDWDQATNMLNDMIDAWKTGNADKLGDLMNTSLRSQPELSKLILADRNKRWADWIATRMATPGTVFVAVGAGHLSGPDSVQTFLKQKRIKSTRVETK
ncbi:MAG: TraB/GumN family protein [Aquidulcibacter sp.]|uniref:TraB/GumN family protein n=1 Tax=Aquidulcibacter sp. TaxID=2052990 RepID=UPI0022C8314B|nr:TraB/GumN family protein [Aquidulcibacter sp.]MCZ8208471.1 TraB/GumN family protein [Aquidulcibacter sp.]